MSLLYLLIQRNLMMVLSIQKLDVPIIGHVLSAKINKIIHYIVFVKNVIRYVLLEPRFQSFFSLLNVLNVYSFQLLQLFLLLFILITFHCSPYSIRDKMSIIVLIVWKHVSTCCFHFVIRLVAMQLTKVELYLMYASSENGRFESGTELINA